MKSCSREKNWQLNMIIPFPLVSDTPSDRYTATLLIRASAEPGITASLPEPDFYNGFMGI
jgi:hypothetical protein